MSGSLELSSYGANSPVLVLGFKRPDLLERVLRILETAGPRKIYVALDGPREHHTGDEKLCMETVRVVERSPITDFGRVRVSKGNLGCRHGPVTGISWFFDQESEGIILEDDCVPNDSFFRFCDQMLEEYRNNPKVGHISGTRFFAENGSADSPAFFSRFASVWGWATWKDRWADFEQINVSGGLQIDKSATSAASKAPGFHRFWWKRLDGIFNGLIDAWDYLWQYSLWNSGRVAIIPPVNLVENQGFGAEATHTLRRPVSAAFHPASRALAVNMRIEVDERIHKGNEIKTVWLLLPILGSQFRSLLRILWTLALWLRRL